MPRHRGDWESLFGLFLLQNIVGLLSRLRIGHVFERLDGFLRALYWIRLLESIRLQLHFLRNTLFLVHFSVRGHDLVRFSILNVFFSLLLKAPLPIEIRATFPQYSHYLLVIHRGLHFDFLTLLQQLLDATLQLEQLVQKEALRVLEIIGIFLFLTFFGTLYGFSDFLYFFGGIGEAVVEALDHILRLV